MIGSQTRPLHVLARGYQLVEAPLPDGRGGLCFTDARTGVVYRRDDHGRTLVLAQERIAGGMVAHRSGGLIISGPSVAELTAGGSWRTLFELPATATGETTFNDIAALPDGSVVAGTLKWPLRPAGSRFAADLYAPDALDGELWRITAEGVAAVVHAPVGISNGLEVAPDGASIFFADTKHRRINHLRITDDGPFELLNQISTAEVGKPDGLAVDVEGTVWAAITDGGLVARFRADGPLLEAVTVPATKVTSVAFVGPASTVLLIGTGTVEGVDDEGGAIFELDTGIAGAPVPEAVI